MKCSRCGCTVFHENEADKMKCDGQMTDEAKAAFEKYKESKLPYTTLFPSGCFEAGYQAGRESMDTKVNELYAYIKKITTTDLGAELEHCDICERLAVLSDSRCRDCADGGMSMRTKRIEKLQAQLAEAEKVIEFYGDKRSWEFGGSEERTQIIHDDEGYPSILSPSGGKRAREYQRKYNGDYRLGEICII